MLIEILESKLIKVGFRLYKNVESGIIYRFDKWKCSSDSEDVFCGYEVI